MSGVSALDTDAPVTLGELLDRNSRAALMEGVQLLGLTLAITDDAGKTIAGNMAAEPASMSADWDPVVATTNDGRYGLIGIYNEGAVLGRIAVGPVPAAIDDNRVRGVLKNVRRMVDAFIVDGMKRALSARMHMATLEEANRELTDKNRELAKMVDKLQEADRVKSNFLATVSHELRTPLTSVIGYSEMLLEGIAGALNDEQREYVRTVMEKGDQLLQLITGILDISRMEAGEMKVRRVPFDLAEVVRIALQTVAPNARRKRLNLECVLPESMPQAVGDRDKTRQVVINLLGNAVKFTPDGGTVKLIVERGSLARVEQPNGAPGLRIAIVDNGIGIPPEHFQRVFDPFYQVDNTSTREYGGTGLGLSIVKRFVEAQGGQVWLESEVNRGTTFRFTLPSEEST
jgi:two-component system sensor histidine kinase BarA